MVETTQALEDVLARLNPQQREAAMLGRCPVLIVAGAGTGKTTTLAHRVACQIASGIAPNRILLLTFTRRAAAEMLRRVEAILREIQSAASDDSTPRLKQKSIAAKVWGGTFHAVATRLLRSYGDLIGLPRDFTILDRGDSEDLMQVVRQDLGLARQDDGKKRSKRQGGTRFPLKGTCQSIYSRAVNSQSPVRKILQDSYPWCLEHEDKLKELFNSYVDRKEEHAVLDYDDLLLFWKALMEHDEAAAVVRSKFDCILVDEYQDTNVVQADILKGLTPDGEGLTVVGDDAQSIYSFRAATVRNILDFPKQFPGTTIVTLEQNYRSTQPILKATNSVIAAAKERHRKELFSDREQGTPPRLVNCLDESAQTEFVIDQILEHRENGIGLSEQAILFRASHHSIALEVELARRNIPFHKYGGLKFIETAHVKDLLGYLRLAENPRDVVSGLRILTLMPGIGPTKARQLMTRLAEARYDFRTWKEYSPPKVTEVDWPVFVALMIGLSGPKARKSAVPEQLYRVRRFYGPLLEQRYDGADARLRDIEQLESISGRFRDRAQFITEMSLDPPSSTQDLAADPTLDEEALVLSTIHSAKGLEWKSVYVIHAADGNIPSERSTESPGADRRGTPAVLRRYHQGQGLAVRHSPAALLLHPRLSKRRPQLRPTQPVPAQRSERLLRRIGVRVLR